LKKPQRLQSPGGRSAKPDPFGQRVQAGYCAIATHDGSNARCSCAGQTGCQAGGRKTGCQTESAAAKAAQSKSADSEWKSFSSVCRLG